MDWQTPWTSPDWIQQSNRMLESYSQLLGDDLLNSSSSYDAAKRARQLFEFDAIVLAHGNQTDPIFSYGNLAALDLWEIDLPTLLTMPSRKSAEPVERTERSEMLTRGLEKGFIADYEGIRISATGKRFLVRNATIWNVFDESEARIGQAATFRDWEYVD